MGIAELGWALIVGEFLRTAALLMVGLAAMSIAFDINAIVRRFDGEAKGKRGN